MALSKLPHLFTLIVYVADTQKKPHRWMGLLTIHLNLVSPSKADWATRG